MKKRNQRQKRQSKQQKQPQSQKQKQIQKPYCDHDYYSIYEHDVYGDEFDFKRTSFLELFWLIIIIIALPALLVLFLGIAVFATIYLAARLIWLKLGDLFK